MSIITLVMNRDNSLRLKSRRYSFMIPASVVFLPLVYIVDDSIGEMLCVAIEFQQVSAEKFIAAVDLADFAAQA